MEQEVFITKYLSHELPPIPCILKARYSDFHVTEILPDHTLVEATAPPPGFSDTGESAGSETMADGAELQTEQASRTEDVQKNGTDTNITAEPDVNSQSNAVEEEEVNTGSSNWTENEPWKSLLAVDGSEDMRAFISSIHDLVCSNDTARKSVQSPPISNKETRSIIHRLLKHDSVNLTTSTTTGTNSIVVSLRKKPKSTSRQPPAPMHIQFSLYKQNRSTMEAISKIAYLLRKSPKYFSFAGTKDRRAVTIQRIVVSNHGHPRITEARLLCLNKALKSHGMWISNVKPANGKLLLGTDLWGNKFNVFLRNLQTTDIDLNMAALKEDGFINYYGMQRFGNSADFRTHSVGIAILKENWSEAVRLIMAPRELGQEKESIHNARKEWQDSPTSEVAEKLVFKFPGSMAAERAVLGHFADSPACINDNLGAINKIPHELKMMYVHAVQSLLWNFMASERISLSRQIMTGDLVMSDNDTVKVVSEDNIAQYSIYDVVLPLLGHNVMHPQIPSLVEKTTNFTLELFGGAELFTIENFGYSCKIGRLAGAYRKLLCKPIGLSYELIPYYDAEETILCPDFEIEAKEEKELPEKRQKPSFVGLRVEFSLPSSSYATMALREMTRIDTSSAYQKQLNFN